ncbi:MAG: response regulator [Christensenellales bacterium]
MHSIMIVDNEAIIRKGLSQGFDWAALACEVVGTAADGAEALDQLRERPVDILISDIRMPGMDGLELTREVRRLYPETKIILVTAFTEFAYAQEALRQQVVDFIIKPTSQEKLRAAVQRAKDLLNQDLQAQILRRSLQEKHQANLLLEQKLFLEGLASGSKQSSLYVRTQSARLHLDLLGSRAIYIHLQCRDDLDDGRLSRFVEEGMRYCLAAFGEHAPITLPFERCGFLAVVRGMALKDLMQALREFIGLIDSMTEFSVQVGVSAPLTEAALLSKGVEEARDACHYLSYDSHQAYMLFEDMPKVTEEVSEQIRNVLKQANDALRRQDLRDIERALHGLEAIVHKERMPLVEVRRCMALLHNMCVNSLLDYDLRSVLDGGLLPKVQDFLDGLVSENLYASFFTVAQETLRLISAQASEADGPVQFLRNYLRVNLDKPLSLDSLAALVHLSPSYLSREFKRVVGENLSTYVSNLRVERAKELMKDSKLKNAEVAQAVGIEDPVYFSRVFKKATGLRPSEFRAKLKES